LARVQVPFNIVTKIGEAVWQPYCQRSLVQHQQQVQQVQQLQRSLVQHQHSLDQQQQA
jgi:hypothetical protein